MLYSEKHHQTIFNSNGKKKLQMTDTQEKKFPKRFGLDRLKLVKK